MVTPIDIFSEPQTWIHCVLLCTTRVFKIVFLFFIMNTRICKSRVDFLHWLIIASLNALICLNVSDCCLSWEQVNCSTFMRLNRSPPLSINISINIFPSIPSPLLLCETDVNPDPVLSLRLLLGIHWIHRQIDRQTEVIKLLFQLQAGRTNSKNKAKPQKGIIDKEETAWEKRQHAPLRLTDVLSNWAFQSFASV